LVAVPAYIAAINLPGAVPALVLLVPYYLLSALWYGPVYATTQSIVDPAMRATAAAVLLFIINLIGLGLGPLGVGLLSDFFAGPIGMGSAEGVRWALIVSALMGVVSFALFWRARHTIAGDMVS
ncbi:MAG: MFS transporter, partial [Caulobacter sp.]|nr:MFS transporter [Caulobacter sp.]